MATPQQTKPSADKASRILDGLAQSLREKGLQHTQVSDIVRHARTSRRTFYECFPDKQSAFVALIQASSVELFETVAAAVDTGAPWEDQIDQAIDAYLAALEDDPALTATISRELPTLGERGRTLQHQGIERFAEFLVATSSSPELRAAGVRPVTRDAALMLIGGISELIGRATHEGRPLSEIGPTAKAVIRAVAAPGG